MRSHRHPGWESLPEPDLIYDENEEGPVRLHPAASSEAHQGEKLSAADRIAPEIVGYSKPRVQRRQGIVGKFAEHALTVYALVMFGAAAVFSIAALVLMITDAI